MKNIHVLATDQPSRLCINGKNGQHIYITNDEEIKEGDWMYYTHFGEDVICKYDTMGGQNTNVNEHKDFYKKIILTTDQDLIKDHVQAIDDEFLEWFVKNPSCEEVEVETSNYFDGKIAEYIIIIPKEEPKQTVQEYEQQGLEKYSYELEPKQEYKYIGECSGNNNNGCFLDSSGHDCGCFTRVLKEPKQETLEEAAEKQWGNVHRTGVLGFIDGAKWQQERMYEIMNAYVDDVMGGCNLRAKEWFEQFKKK